MVNDFKVPLGWQRRIERDEAYIAALKRLAKQGCDSALLCWYLWHFTKLEIWKTAQKSHALNQSEIRRFRKLLRDLTGLHTTVRQATDFFRVNGSRVAEFPDHLTEFREWLGENCKLNRYRRLSFLDFIEPLIQQVRIPFQHSPREAKSWTDDLAILIDASFIAHRVNDRDRPSVSGPGLREHLKRKKHAVKPKVVLCD